MPVGRYFLYIGSVLLALLFVADWYLAPLGAGPSRSGVDRTTIRIHSSHKWPQAVVIDTTLPTIVPPQAMTAAAPAPPPPGKSVRDAFALAEATPAAAPTEAVKAAKPHVRRPRVARAPAGHGPGYDVFGSRDMFAPRNDMFGSRNMWSMGW
jgi:hypothetical protein